MEQTPGVAGVDESEGELGWLTITFQRDTSEDASAVAGDAIRALLDAGIPVLSFELEGGRLSDAFLYLTGEKNA
jgi:hypothetical protein